MSDFRLMTRASHRRADSTSRRNCRETWLEADFQQSKFGHLSPPDARPRLPRCLLRHGFSCGSAGHSRETSRERTASRSFSILLDSKTGRRFPACRSLCGCQTRLIDGLACDKACRARKARIDHVTGRQGTVLLRYRAALVIRMSAGIGRFRNYPESMIGYDKLG